jgi:hypothetical protein
MWYNKIASDLSEVASAIDYYNNELVVAQSEPKITGNIEKNIQELSGMMSYRFGQLQDIEAILKYLNIKYDKMRSDFYRRYSEHYNKELTDRSIEKYIDGEPDIISMSILINEISLVRNRYLALIKGFDTKQYMLTNMVKLKIAGLIEHV